MVHSQGNGPSTLPPELEGLNQLIASKAATASKGHTLTQLSNLQSLVTCAVQVTGYEKTQFEESESHYVSDSKGGHSETRYVTRYGKKEFFKVKVGCQAPALPTQPTGCL